MTDDDETYPWEEEYLAWCRAQPQVSVYEQMKTAEEWDRILPKAKASDILAVASEVLDTPEIVDRYAAYIKRRQDPNATFENVHGEPCNDYEDVKLARASQLAHNYYKWWRMKRHINDNYNAYSNIPNLVYLVTEGKISEADMKSIKDYLFRYHERQIIDDSLQFGRKK